jgi:pimeloyl-ACP methyl ester carboxylesterase
LAFGNIMTLPEDMLAIANRESNEEGWRLADFPAVLARASFHRLACIGGQFQFRGPIGSAEMYWLNADSTPRKQGEDWDGYVERANSEVLRMFNRLVEQTDFRAEARQWEHITEAINKGTISDPTEHLYFVAYFDRSPEIAEGHWSECGRATSVANSSALGRPHRSVLSFDGMAPLRLPVKNGSERAGRPAKRKRSFAIGAVLCLTVLLLTQCATPPPSRFAARPDSIPEGLTLEPVAVDGLDADFFYRAAGRPQKVVVLLGGSEGGRSWSHCSEFIRELIDQGFCVLSLPYFGTPDLPVRLRAVPLEYFAKAFAWLGTQQDLVVPDDYALVGGSRGAELALLVASRYSEVKAVIAIAPSSVVLPGPVARKLEVLGGQHSPWSENGKELPFVPMAYSWTSFRGLMTGKQTRMVEKALRNSGRVREATIPVENIQGPILLVSFTRDDVWPSVLMSEQIVGRLRDREFGYSCEHASYDAGHCEWGIEPCRTNMLRFLRDRFLAPAAGQGSLGTVIQTNVEP